MDEALALIARLKAERSTADDAARRAAAALQRAYAAASRIGAPVDLLEWIEAHCRATGTAPTALGVQVLNDPRFVSGLREGRSPRRKTEARVRAYLEAVA